MGAKADTLRSLLERGFNVHEFKLVQIENEYQAVVELHKYYRENRYFSVRCDCEEKLPGLPFIVIEDDFYFREAEISNFVRECIRYNGSMLLSNGRASDKYQIANVVAELTPDTIRMEVSSRDCTLRHMYRYPNDIVAFVGSPALKIKEFETYGSKCNIPDSDLEKFLSKVYSLNKTSKAYVEATIYKKKVGVLNEDIIFWEIL